MSMSRRALASGRALLGAVAASTLLRRTAYGQPAATPGSIAGIAVRNLAALRAYDIRQVQGGAQIIAQVAGYDRPGDGGGGLFQWVPDSTELDDPKTPNMAPVINVPSTVAGLANGRWVRQLPDRVLKPEMAGAIGDGKADDAGAFDRLRHLLGERGGTIRLSPGKFYRISGADLFVPKHAVIEGSDGAMGQTAPNFPNLLATGGILLDPRRTIRLDYFAVLRGVAVIREGLVMAGPTDADDVRRTVTVWANENGENGTVRSIGITIGGHATRVSNCLIIGFHTALHSKGYAAFLIEQLYFDCANGIEISECRDTSRIRDCHANQFWSSNIGKVESLHRPGIGYNFHDHCDGLIVEDSYATGFRVGWRLSNVWAVTLRTPQVEGFSPDGGKTPVYGFLFENIVTQVRIYDAYADMGAGGVGLYLMHTDAAHAPAPLKTGIQISDVTFFGGSIGASAPKRPLVICGPQSRGQMIGVTFEGGGPNAVVLQAGIGAWRFIAPLFGTFTAMPWLQVMDPADWARVYVAAAAVWWAANPAEASLVQTHINETTWIAADGSLAKHDGTPSAPLTVHNTAQGSARNQTIALARGAADRPTVVGSIATDGASTYYNTASDYRLKTVRQALDDPWELIGQMRVHLGHFNAHPENELPFLLAHEVQEVAPYAVTGEKDTVDAAGQPLIQQIDMSKLVPLMLAALVSQRQINREVAERLARGSG